MRYSSLSQTASLSATQSTHAPIRANVWLWVVQWLLAILFLFAGAAKLTMPAQILATQSGLPVAFMRFIAVAEVFGAFGLVLPRLLRLRAGLTPLAASGLIMIMVGAVILTIIRQGVAPAILPCVVGSLLSLVIRANWRRGIWLFTSQAEITFRR